MECKEAYSNLKMFTKHVLIETLWNVKYIITSLFPQSISVLIETLWNVKSEVPAAWPLPEAVLIETLWNVKHHPPLSAVLFVSMY